MFWLCIGLIIPQDSPYPHLVVSSVRLTVVIRHYATVQFHIKIHQSIALHLKFILVTHLWPLTCWLWRYSTHKQHNKVFGHNNNKISFDSFSCDLHTLRPWNLYSNTFYIIATPLQSFKVKLRLVVEFWILQEFLHFGIFLALWEKNYFLNHTTKLCLSDLGDYIR